MSVLKFSLFKKVVLGVLLSLSLNAVAAKVFLDNHSDSNQEIWDLTLPEGFEAIEIDDWPDDKAMTLKSYNPNKRMYLKRLITQKSPMNSDLMFYLSPISTAVYEAFSMSVKFSPQNGLTDDYQRISIGGVLTDASITNLMLEGLPRFKAENVGSTILNNSLSAIMSSKTGNKDVQILFQRYFKNSYWKSENISLRFVEGGVLYEHKAIGDYEVGTYKVTNVNNSLMLRITLENSGVVLSDLSALRKGDMYLPFMSENLKRQ